MPNGKVTLNVCDFFPLTCLTYIHTRYGVSGSKPWRSFKGAFILCCAGCLGDLIGCSVTVYLLSVIYRFGFFLFFIFLLLISLNECF